MASHALSTRGVNSNRLARKRKPSMVWSRPALQWATANPHACNSLTNSTSGSLTSETLRSLRPLGFRLPSLQLLDHGSPDERGDGRKLLVRGGLNLLL